MNPFPGVIPAGIGKEASQHFSIQIALAVEMTVECAAREAGPRHYLIDRDVVETKPIEQLSSTLNDLLSRLLTMTLRVRHKFPLCGPYGRTFSPGIAQYDLDHI